MIRAEDIPDEVVEAAVSAYNYASTDCYSTEKQDMTAAIAAAINAWPGAEIAKEATEERLHIILPLPQDPRDD